MGVVVNFTSGTVAGFGWPPLEYPVKIRGVNDAMITFGGSQQRGDVESRTTGSIDRVTGDAEATSTTAKLQPYEERFHTNYTLKCKPVKRMF
jgi:hypothetical protein